MCNLSDLFSDHAARIMATRDKLGRVNLERAARSYRAAMWQAKQEQEAADLDAIDNALLAVASIKPLTSQEAANLELAAFRLAA